jgi:hypothetical protein
MRYTTFGHHLDPDAILEFRLGYSCGNDQEGPPSGKTWKELWLAIQDPAMFGGEGGPGAIETRRLAHVKPWHPVGREK